MMVILSIDPGNIKSAYCAVDSTNCKPLAFDKVDNEILFSLLRSAYYDKTVIEMICSYGMAVGSEVFSTCMVIGRLIQLSIDSGTVPILIPRSAVKLNLCHSSKAKDGNIRQALIDRFGRKGTKANPGWFYNFKSDIWAAYAVGVTYLDNLKKTQ